MAIFGHIWQYLTIDGPSCPIWVEHRLNRVEHCISHMEGPVQPLWTHQKWSLGSQGAPKIGHFWPYLAIFGYRQPNCPIWVEHQLNRVEHCISHMEGPVRPLWTYQNGPRGPRGPPKTAIFGHSWQYLAIDWRSCPIWVEHRLNRVEHCISPMEGPVRPLWTHRKWSQGSQEAPKRSFMAIFGNISP